MGPLTQTQITAIVAAFGCVTALLAAFVHDRAMARRSVEGEPWIKPTHPLALLVLATMLSIVTAILALQGR